MQTPGRDQRWTVGELLGWTTERLTRLGVESPRVDAQHLLAHALACGRMDLYLQHDRLVEDAERARFRTLVKRRLEREPVAYIEGRRGFHGLGLDLEVDRRVLIPRPETELLVDWVLETLRPPPAPLAHVVDVGTGSGAIALALRFARDDLDVLAVDVSADALAVAQSNAERLELPIRLERSDLLADVTPPEGGFAIVAANLPYIPSADLAGLQPEVRDFEPRLALDGGADGLDLVRRLIAQVAAPGVLAPGGGVFLEIGVGQADATAALLADAGLEPARRADLAGIPRVVAGRRPR